MKKLHVAKFLGDLAPELRKRGVESVFIVEQGIGESLVKLSKGMPFEPVDSGYVRRAQENSLSVFPPMKLSDFESGFADAVIICAGNFFLDFGDALRISRKLLLIVSEKADHPWTNPAFWVSYEGGNLAVSRQESVEGFSTYEALWVMKPAVPQEVVDHALEDTKQKVANVMAIAGLDPKDAAARVVFDALEREVKGMISDPVRMLEMCRDRIDDLIRKMKAARSKKLA
jgi:hypothetical protein